MTPSVQILANEAARRGITGRELARAAHVDPSLVSKLLSGRRPAISPTFRSIAHRVNSARVWLQLSYEVTEGLFTAPWPDGPIAAPDPQSVFLKLGEEAREAEQALHELIPYLTRRPEAVADADRERIEDILLQVLDLVRCGQIMVAAACDEYDIDVVALHRRHDDKLVRNGTISATMARRAA